MIREDIYIQQLEHSVGNKLQNNNNNNQDSPIRQISLFSARGSGSKTQASQQNVSIQAKNRLDQSAKIENLMNNISQDIVLDQQTNQKNIISQVINEDKMINSNNKTGNYTIRQSIAVPQIPKAPKHQNIDSSMIQQQMKDSLIPQYQNVEQQDEEQPNIRQKILLQLQENQNIEQSQPLYYNNKNNNAETYKQNTKEEKLQQQMMKTTKQIEEKQIIDSQTNAQSIHQSVRQTRSSQSIKQNFDNILDINDSQKKSSGPNSEERQKFPTFDQGLQKMQNFNEITNGTEKGNKNYITNSSDKQNRNYSPSFNQDLFSLQQQQQYPQQATVSNSQYSQEMSQQQQMQEYRQKQDSITQQRDDNKYIQSNTNSTSQLSQLKSKGSLSGHLIESINLANNQQIKSGNVNRSIEQNNQMNQNNQQQSQALNKNTNINHSQRKSCIENGIQGREFSGISQNRGSLKTESQINAQQINKKFQQGNYQQMNNNSQHIKQDQFDIQTINDSKSIHDSNQLESISKQYNDDIPEEEEIADENSDSIPSKNQEQQDIKQSLNPLKQNQLQQHQYSKQNTLNSQNYQQNNDALSLQNGINDSQRQESMQSSQFERTPENQNKKSQQILSSSQMTGQNHSHSPFRKSMYASYQTSSFKGVNSNQLLQYSANSSNSKVQNNPSQRGSNSQFEFNEENQNNLSSYNPYSDQQKTIRNSMQISKGNQNIINSEMRNSKMNQSNNNNRSILTQKNELFQQSGLDISQLSDNRSRNSQIYLQDSNAIYSANEFTYNNIQREINPNAKLSNLLQDFDTPIVANSLNQINRSSISYSPFNNQLRQQPSSFEGALERQAQQYTYGYQKKDEDIDSEPDEVERQSDTWLRDSVIENNEDSSNEYKRDSKNKQIVGGFKLNTKQQQETIPKPIFYGVPINFQETQIFRKI